MKKNKNEFKKQIARYKLINFLNNATPTTNTADLVESFKLNLPFLLEFEQSDEYDPNNEQLKLSLQYHNTWGGHYIR